MASSSWKQREIVNREGELLRIARRLLLEKGFGGLTMEKVADETEYSKGTIYQHFSSKEDVIAALCMEVGTLRLNLLERAAVFRGRSRERALALAMAMDIIYCLYPDFWRTEELTSSTHIRQKLPPERRSALNQQSERTFSIALGIIRDGLVSGDLAPPPDLTPETIFLGLLGMTKGYYSLWSSDWLNKSWVNDVAVTHQKLFGAACDGFRWHPFAHEWDYAKTVERIWTEVFPEESARLKGKPADRSAS